MLDCEFTYCSTGRSPSASSGNDSILAGTTDGHAKAAEISRGKLRAILESARGIKSDDVSPQARAGSTVKLAGIRRPAVHRQDRHREGQAEGNGATTIPTATYCWLNHAGPERVARVEQTPRRRSPANTAYTAAPAPARDQKPAWAS